MLKKNYIPATIVSLENALLTYNEKLAEYILSTLLKDIDLPSLIHQIKDAQIPTRIPINDKLLLPFITSYVNRMIAES